ncbi:MAG: type II toxin-antitoxin system VapC family toxin [Parachlamydia sp.]|nr:type II toxin-antitoxin system VapC family toxin [Parachlamydia sp.]
MVESNCLMDTDVLVDFLRGVPPAVKYLHKMMADSICYVSTITIAELYAGVRDGKERLILDQFIQEFSIAPTTVSMAQIGGIYRRDYGKSHSVGLADALIAATAEELSLSLVTLNKKHFPMLRKVHVPYQKE